MEIQQFDKIFSKVVDELDKDTVLPTEDLRADVDPYTDENGMLDPISAGSYFREKSIQYSVQLVHRLFTELINEKQL
ncbi:hypothetical protein [Enterococcus wangshanyuanii]|uniref:YozE SAM-like domain-containing protein n=1 Tax=Enterococcus wangshanyuanii TaxID=2005703 RepID=A0ABQ1NTK6_9ENTE|nr:hypothetical protein [Enterococcus wangshanyuanii]GGC84575.1 hypothetical protein GCM10011573_12730 [Enterococcus wangshanyuanii]